MIEGHAVGGKTATMDEVDFRRLSKLAKSRFGLHLSDSKKPLVYSRVSRRLRALSIESFSEYFHLLETDGCKNEIKELATVLTTNVSGFFREKHHFDSLEQEISSIVKQGSGYGDRVRIWSAGCSNGQEPYSIAATVLSSAEGRKLSNIKILATDLDSVVLSHAKHGVYAKSEVENLDDREKQILLKGASESGDSVSMSSEYKRMISFAELNLMAEWPFRGPFDVIFCRNVAIYFDQSTQATLWKRFCDYLRPGGVLFIGHSERVSGSASSVLEPFGVTSYRKRS